MASAARRPEGFLRSNRREEPRLAECFDFPFDVIFDAANRECGAIDQEVMMQTYQQ